MKRAFITVLALIGLTGCVQIEEGERGVLKNLGKLSEDVVTPGITFYNPATVDVETLDVRERPYRFAQTAYTKDTQTVVVVYTVTLFLKPESVVEVYRQFGENWVGRVVNPSAISAMKDAVGQYAADDLVNKREMVRDTAQKSIIAELENRGVHVTRIDILNLDFNDAYEAAVEAKVVASQKAKESANKTVQVQEEAKQRVAMAEAEAKAMKIQSEALAKSKNLVELEAVRKWDGKMPQIIMGGGTTPLVNMDTLLKQGK